MAKEGASVREIVDEGLSAAAQGLDIVKQTKADQQLGDRDDDGPRMRAWMNRPATSAPTPPPLSDEMTERIERIVAYERAGHWPSAGAGLVQLRRRYEDYNAVDLADDELSWEAFAAKHIPLPAMRVGELIGRMVHKGGLLRCTSCNVRLACECGCGVPYVVDHPGASRALPVAAIPEPGKAETALDRAIAAVTASPEKSNRALAAEIGVGDQTVRRARQQMAGAGDDGAVDGAVDDGRVGRDGRRRRLPK